MTKPVVFLSHSSHDRSLAVRLKALLAGLTGGAVDFFLSSDGQSIPLGTNWVHTVQKALESSELMFVFASPAAVHSDWIHFESGFAYSKGTQVVPIGVLGQDVGNLRPPLSLLQGFNLRDKESFGNLVALINSKYHFTFQETISEQQYQALFYRNPGNHWGARSTKIKSFVFVGQDNKQIGLQILVEKYLIKESLEHAVSERIEYKTPETRIDLDGVSIVFRHYEDRDGFIISVDPYSWGDRLATVRKILNQLSDNIVDRPQFSIHLTDCYFSEIETYRILPRLRAFNVSLLRDGSYQYNKLIDFRLDREMLYDDEGVSYLGEPVVRFKIGIDDLDVANVTPVIDMLIDAGVLLERNGDSSIF